MQTRTRHAMRGGARPGFTLVEVLIATTVTLLLMGLVVQIFAIVGNTASDTRSTIQMIDRLRAARQTLQADLEGITCAGVTPPLDPKLGLGFLEIIEGPIGSRFFPSAAPMLIAEGSVFSATNNFSVNVTPGVPPGDPTLGDLDDVLMFTTTTQGDPFVGKFFSPMVGAVTTNSDVAEVCYFLRGTTLYRRQLLVKPGLNVVTGMGFYGSNDISVHQEGGPYDNSPNPAAPGTPRAGRLVANSLGDLTKRENRYGHQPFAIPFDARFWGPLGLPTLRECTFTLGTPGSAAEPWPFPLFDPANSPTPVWGLAMPYAASVPPTLPVPAGNLIFPNPPSGTVQPASGQLAPGSLPAFPQIPQIYLSTTTNFVFDVWPQTSSLNPNYRTPYPWDQTTYFPATPQAPNPWSPNQEPNGSIYGFSASNMPASPPSSNLRYSEDVILTNVISFDVKVWDPDAPIVGHPGLDGLPGIAGFDDDHDGTVDDITEMGAAGSDDLVWQPGDCYPDSSPSMLPSFLQGYASSYSYAGSSSTVLSGANNWANTQYLTVLAQAISNSPPVTATPSTSLAVIIQRGAYVDLAYAQNPNVGTSLTNPFTPFCGPGDFRSLLWAGGTFGGAFFAMPAVYDTGSTSYEDDGLDEDAITVGAFGTSSYGPDQGTNGTDDNLCAGPDDYSGEPFQDNNNNGLKDGGDTFIAAPTAGYLLWDLNGNGVYDPPETEMPPPYRTKLGGIQVKIRAFDPDSRQIREVTIVQELENE